MIAKIVKGSDFSGAIGYMLSKKEKAEILRAKGLRTSSKEMLAKSFQLQASMRENIAKPVWHIALNFSKHDSDKLTNEKMIEIAEAYMEKMSIQNTQYLIVRHYDTEHPHIHLCINRIDNAGKLISDQHEKYRSTTVCKELTKKYRLHFAKGKESVKRGKLIGNDKIKYELYDTLKMAVPKSKNWEELRKYLKQDGIQIHFKMRGNTNKIQGVIFEKNGVLLNGSKVDRKYSYSKIDYIIKTHAYQSLKETEQVLKEREEQSPIEELMDFVEEQISCLNVFTFLDSPHYDATLADYIKMLRAKKYAARNKVKIRRIR